MELARRLQLRRAVGAARHVLLQFVTSVVRQFVIDVEQNIFLYPFAFHNCTPRLPALVPSCARPDSRGRLSPRDL